MLQIEMDLTSGLITIIYDMKANSGGDCKIFFTGHFKLQCKDVLLVLPRGL